MSHRLKYVNEAPNRPRYVLILAAEPYSSHWRCAKLGFQHLGLLIGFLAISSVGTIKEGTYVLNVVP
jgi:hypothetical protein